MTFQGTNQALLWTDYSIIARYSISYSVFQAAGLPHANWVQSMFVSPYKYYILIKTMMINHSTLYQHDWKLKLNGKEKHLKITQPSTSYLFSKIYRFTGPRQRQKDMEREMDTHLNTTVAFVCVVQRNGAQIPPSVSKCHCNVRCLPSANSNDQTSFSGL